jgi:hypothetical protein
MRHLEPFQSSRKTEDFHMKLLDILTVNVVDLKEKLPAVWTKKAKLHRWGYLVAKYGYKLVLFHGMEHWSPVQLRDIPIHAVEYGPNAFAIACADPVLQDAGLKEKANLPEIMRFFEITTQQLHEFSCDCGGAITARDMANRITNLA